MPMAPRRSSDRGRDVTAGRRRRCWRREIPLTPMPRVHGYARIIASVRTQNTVLHEQPNPDLTVEVTGFQWSWRFTYPESGVEVVGSSRHPPELVVPANRTVHVRLR